MSKLVSLVLSFYVALIIYSNAFFIKALTVAKASDQLFWNKLGIFAIILIPTVFIVSKYVVAESARGAGVVKVVLVSLAMLGLIIAFFYHVVPISPIYHLPKILDPYFAPDSLFTIWLIAPIIVLLI